MCLARSNEGVGIIAIIGKGSGVEDQVAQELHATFELAVVRIVYGRSNRGAVFRAGTWRLQSDMF
jgi:hypothetical protein